MDSLDNTDVKNVYPIRDREFAEDKGRVTTEQDEDPSDLDCFNSSFSLQQGSNSKHNDSAHAAKSEVA